MGESDCSLAKLYILSFCVGLYYNIRCHFNHSLLNSRRDTSANSKSLLVRVKTFQEFCVFDMKLFSLFLIVALCAISSVECGCSNEARKIKNKDEKNHVLCVQFKNSNCLHCKANGRYLKCDTKPPVNSNPAVSQGPAPDGHYAIGSVYKHPKHSISWANLYPRKKDRTGWWDYYRGNPDVPGSRSHIALHPGSTSWGCVTVTDSYCWRSLETMLKSKRGDYITVSKTLWRTARVKRIGLLRAIN